MKEWIIFCLLLSCEPYESKYGVKLAPAAEQSTVMGKSPRYWKDARTGLCFAEFMTAYSFYVSTNVPCSAVEAAITQDSEGAR